MTEDELYEMLMAKGRSKYSVDPAICRIACRHILAFMADLNTSQQQSVMRGLGQLVGEIEMLERRPRGYYASASRTQAKPKAFDKFVNFITLDWLV